MTYHQDADVLIRDLAPADVPVFVQEEIAQGWHATAEKYEEHLLDAREGRCIALAAEWRGSVAGYVNIYFNGRDGALGGQGLPIIEDFGVLEKYRRRGVGSRLMDAAERLAAQRADQVYLGVGLHDGYGSAQRMYVKRGYVPDGTGVWYNGKPCTPYDTIYTNNDDLVLFLVKQLKSSGEARMPYELKSARFLASEILERAVRPGDTVIDATMGNGHDTLLLCRLVGAEGRVYAFDVQPRAVENTRQRLAEAGVADRALLFCEGHEHLSQRVPGQAAAAVFNLGWLPGGDHGVTTRWETTQTAVRAALSLLQPLGVLLICAYPGHEEGDRERRELAAFLSALPPQQFNVLRHQFLNAGPGAPECFVVQKQRAGQAG